MHACTSHYVYESELYNTATYSLFKRNLQVLDQHWMPSSSVA